MMINTLPFAMSVSIRQLVKHDVFVNNNKGYALRRLGIYSANIVEQIIHSIIPLNDLCVTQPNANICSYSSQLRTTKIFELSTVLASGNIVQTFSYDKDDVSKSIGNDIIRVFSQHQPEQFMNKQNDMIHFSNNKFYHKNQTNQAIQSTLENNVVDNFSDIPRIRSTSAQQVIHHINNHKVNLDYLSFDGLESFISAMPPNLNVLHAFSNVRDILNSFNELIIGQSIYGLPSCSLADEKTDQSLPCLVISTLFINVPVDHVSAFYVYRFISLPIVVDQNKYIYSNLPEIIAINPVDNTLLTWNEEADIKKCTFSTIVSCQEKPSPLSLFKSSCLAQLLDDDQGSTSLCDVSRSVNIQHNILRISDGLWLLYNVPQTTNCQVYSNVNILPELMSIKEPALISLPCDKSMMCIDFQIPSTSCKRNYSVATSTFDFAITNSSRSVISIGNMTRNILQAYNSQFNKTIDDFKTIFKTNQITIYQTVADFAVYIVTFISFLLIVIFLRCLAVMKFRLEREMRTLLLQLRKLLKLQSTVDDSWIAHKP